MVKAIDTSKYTTREIANPKNDIIHPSATGLVRTKDGKHKKITWAQVILYAQDARNRKNTKYKVLKCIMYEPISGTGNYDYFSILVTSDVKPSHTGGYLFVMAQDRYLDEPHYVTPTSKNSNIYNDFVSGKIFSKLW